MSVWVGEREYRCLQRRAAVPAPDVGGRTWTWVLWKSSATCELLSRFSSLLQICFLFNSFWCWSLNGGPRTCSGQILPPSYTCLVTKLWSDLQTSFLTPANLPYLGEFCGVLEVQQLLCDVCLLAVLSSIGGCWGCRSSLLVVKGSVYSGAERQAGPEFSPGCSVWSENSQCDGVIIPRQMFFGVSLLSRSGFWMRKCSQAEAAQTQLACPPWLRLLLPIILEPTPSSPFPWSFFLLSTFSSLKNEQITANG